MDSSFNKLRNWLDLTEQQFDILKAVMRIESKKEPPTAKNLTKVYETYNPKGIQKSNLYSILKTLETTGFIKHDSPGNYSVNYAGIQDKLNELKKRREEEDKELDTILTQTREYVRIKASEPDETFVKYYDNKGLNDVMMKFLSTAKNYYTTDRFPNIALPRSWAIEDWKQRYVDLLYDRCAIKKELTIYYLSDLNIDRYYNFMSDFYKNRDFVFNECMSMIDKLDNILKNNDNLHVAVSDGIFVIDVHMGEQEEPVEYISHMHDLQSRTMGGVYIKSREAASYIKQYFFKKFDDSPKLEGKNKNRILNQVKKRLRELHNSSSINKTGTHGNEHTTPAKKRNRR